MSILKVPIGKRDHIYGSIDARVKLVEYGDFECPNCGAAYSIVKRIQQDLGDRLCLIFRHFPLKEIHEHAFSAACAAEAAGKQNKFWDMHDMLFEHQDALHDEDLIKYGGLLGLDMPQFIKDMDSTEVEKKVREDFMSGVRSGVNGTPTFYINGIRYDDSYDYDNFKNVLEKEAGYTFL